MCAEALIRLARPDDLAYLVALEQASFREPWAAISIQEALDNRRSIVLIAHCNGVACGHVIASMVGDECDLARIAVSPARRGCGLGSRLMEAFLSECQRRGVLRLFLEVRAGNEAAHRLYERTGFRQVGLRRRYYRDGEDAIIMAKTLSSE